MSKIIDGNNLMFRAFYALPQMANFDGEISNAVFGFTNMIVKVIKEVQPKYIAVTLFTKRQITQILKEIEKIDLQKSRLMDLYSVGGIALDEIASKIAPLSDRKSKLEEDLKSIKKSPISVKEAVKKVTSFSDVLDSGDFDNIRQIILALIDRIDIDNDTIEIHWKFC